MNSDGTASTPFTHLTAANADSLVPAWSSDGSMLSFSSFRALDGSDATNTNGTSNIWVIKSDGTGATALTKLTAAGANSVLPVWRP